MSQEKNAALKVLVADDNVDAAESLCILLEMVGHTVQMAHDGPGVLQAVEQYGPDVILLDIGLPGMDGHEVARRLRAGGGQGSRALLIAVTGYSSDEDVSQSRAAGFDHHLVKPVDPELLLSLLTAAAA